MYTYIAQDYQGNYFISKGVFYSEQEAMEAAFSLAEYNFIVAIDVLKCEDVVCFNILNPILN
jgi:hypothetical protein